MSNNHINVITGIHIDKYEWTGGWTWETIHDVTTISVHLCAYTFISDPWQWSYILASGLYSLHQATRSMQMILTCALSRPSSESCRFNRTDQHQKRYISCTFLTSFLDLNKKRSCHFDTSGSFHSVSCLSKQKNNASIHSQPKHLCILCHIFPWPHGVFHHGQGKVVRKGNRM